MGFPNTSTAITALRELVKDNLTDKLAFNKQLVSPAVDGVNLIFKSFEQRRLTNFTQSASFAFPLGVYINGTNIGFGKVTNDDIESGILALDASVVPNNRDSVRATYYYQWFIDSELDQFFQNASNWLTLGPIYINVPDGLNIALLRFAAQEAYTAVAAKYMVRMSQVYKMEDAPNEDVLKSIQGFKDLASSFMKDATQLRDDYYTRAGQSLQPLFSLGLGGVRDPVPRR